MKIQEQLSPNFSTPEAGKKYYGKPRTFEYIVIHWWDDPKNKPTLQGSIDWMKKAGTSAHYIVSDNTIIKLVEEENMAWHARDANPYTIGIEVDPQTPGNTYNTVNWLVNDIKKRRGITKVVGHNHFVNTTCPGTLDLVKIEKDSEPMVTLPQKELDAIRLARDTHYNDLQAERVKVQELNSALKEMTERLIQCENRPPTEKIVYVTSTSDDVKSENPPVKIRTQDDVVIDEPKNKKDQEYEDFLHRLFRALWGYLKKYGA